MTLPMLASGETENDWQKVQPERAGSYLLPVDEAFLCQDPRNDTLKLNRHLQRIHMEPTGQFCRRTEASGGIPLPGTR